MAKSYGDFDDWLIGRPVASAPRHAPSFDYWLGLWPLRIVLTMPRRADLSYVDFSAPSVAGGGGIPGGVVGAVNAKIGLGF